MAESLLAPPRPSSGNTPPNCAICLGTCQNKCYSDSCMHEFCYKCLLEWSKIKAECPLCKQTFKSILYNIKSTEEYDEHIVENITVEDNHYLENASLIYLPPVTPPAIGNHQYHFRTTFTVDTHGEHAIQQMLLSHPLITIGTYTPERFTTRFPRRRRGDTSTSFRRSVYNQNLWVESPPDFTGRYREVSPTYFRNNPAARARLVPWLNRELNALLYENTQHVMHLVDIIMDHLLRHHICSVVFRTLLNDYLGNKTDHFIHEFYNFMRSPYDMIGYDRHVTYHERRAVSPIPQVDISDYDSDVILVSSSTGQHSNQPPTTDPVVIDLLDTDSDEPIIVSEMHGNFNDSVIPIPDEDREPILPLKLRIKNYRHKSKEKRRKRHRTAPSVSSFSSPSTSDVSSEDEYELYSRHRRKLKKHKKKVRHEKQTEDETEVNSSCDDDVPLVNFTHKRKRKRHHSHHHRSHTITSNEAAAEVPKIERRRSLSPTVASSSSPTKPFRADLSLTDIDLPSNIPREALQTKLENESPCEDEEDPYEVPQIRSKIREVRPEDRSRAGPSSGRLRNILRKEESSNLWYSRPCVYNSSSDCSD